MSLLAIELLQDLNPIEEAYNEGEKQNAEEAAAAVNCTVEYSDPFTLQLDIDSTLDLAFFHEQWNRLCGADSVLNRAILDQRRSRSGNYHITIKCDEEMSIERRIMFQSLLGSDRVREALNYTRHVYGAENPIRLFRPKEEWSPDVDPDFLPF